MSPDESSLGETAESLEGEHDSSDEEHYRNNDSSDDDEPRHDRRVSVPMGSAMLRGNHGITLKGSLDDFLGDDDDEQTTMWLGTEDGRYVFGFIETHI